ncbi:MAG: DUF2752 domain-containing protein [Balneolales bacterium]|nr:DUF2752 domain-containing protein [Balneolales bacterium]
MKLIKRHSEWVVFLTGLVLMGAMDPYNNADSLCLFELLGLPFCIGEGLGHSIAFFFRGELKLAFEANFMGPLAVFILTFRIITIWKDLLIRNQDLMELNHV